MFAAIFWTWNCVSVGKTTIIMGTLQKLSGGTEEFTKMWRRKKDSAEKIILSFSLLTFLTFIHFCLFPLLLLFLPLPLSSGFVSAMFLLCARIASPLSPSPLSLSLSFEMISPVDDGQVPAICTEIPSEIQDSGSFLSCRCRVDWIEWAKRRWTVVIPCQFEPVQDLWGPSGFGELFATGHDLRAVSKCGRYQM